MSTWLSSPSKQILPEVQDVLWHSLLGDSVFTCNITLQTKHSSAFDMTPAKKSVLQFEVLSLPAVLIQISSEISLILLSLRRK